MGAKLIWPAEERFEQIKRDIRVADEYENNFGGNYQYVYPFVEQAIEAIKMAHDLLRGDPGRSRGPQKAALQVLRDFLEQK